MRKLKAKGHSETARVLRMLLRTSGDLELEDPTPWVTITIWGR